MKANRPFWRKIEEHITKLESAGDIFSLFELLNYPKKHLFDTSSKRKKSTFDFKKDDRDKIKEIYSILSFNEKLQVFLLEATSIAPSFLRSVTATFDRQYLHFLLIFTIDYSEVVFVFPKREKVDTGKHKLKVTKLIINKNEIHYTDIQTLANIYFEEESKWRDVWRKWTKAFSVERVTEAFFEDYKKIFFTLRNELNRQKISRKESHEFTLQFLNRLMFIYFISKKKWLAYPKFMDWLWDSYKRLGKYGSDEFYEKWLRQVFFKAFNNRAGEITDLPEDIVKEISNLPFLNGGLFTPNKLDELKVRTTDSLFQTIFDFYEKYNFTIKEDMPLESEVAVDPQMLGYVYESLANVAEEIYDRNDMGIFYTPRVEVDFMCRRSLVEYLSKHMGDVPKEKFYHLIFDPLEDKSEIEKYFQKEKLWDVLEDRLDDLSVVDPACGSGAFLVGMLNVLVGLYKTIYKYKKIGLTDFQLKNRIIGRSLYGVDVMPWAIHAAELRLWLQLIIETEFKREELRRHALLPNLNMNLRIGDSLVQEIGGLSLNLRDSNISNDLKKKLSSLKNEKRKYYEISPTAKFKTENAILKEETRIFEEIINERIAKIENEIDKIKEEGKQLNVLGETAEDLSIEKRRKNRIEEFENEKKRLLEIQKEITNLEKRPFVWDIDFVEIFGDKDGFDIVIGNPPYVRQEIISPPNRLKSEVTLEDRRSYKDKLIESVRSQFPVVQELEKKSDYYLYFYFHGLSLLNDNGTLCFITSNSWLDVDYGKRLQEFLLKYVPILAIYDNTKRSFVHADVNTIIALFGAPGVRYRSLMDWIAKTGRKINNEWSEIRHVAKFVMFKKSFEEVLCARNLIEIEKTTIKSEGGNITELVKNVVSSQDYRLFPVLQEDLLEDGWVYPEDYNDGKFKAGKYGGNKWGGKYLRAPDIFLSIIGKRNKFCELENIATIRFGIKTGCNEFFILNRKRLQEFEIEREFLKPVITSPKNIATLIATEEDIKEKIFICSKNRQQLKGTKALKYIEWGENNKWKCKIGGSYNLVSIKAIPSIKNRKIWYQLKEYDIPDIIFQELYNDKTRAIYNAVGAHGRAPLYYCSVKANIDEMVLVAILNSSLMQLFCELYGRSYGAGVLDIKVYELRKIPVLKSFEKADELKKAFSTIGRRKQRTLFEELGINPSKPIHEQEPKPLPDRAELDNIIFDELGLTQEERKEVYWSVCDLVKQRLDKAKSLKK